MREQPEFGSFAMLCKNISEVTMDGFKIED
jgi:hypothetical protein